MPESFWEIRPGKLPTPLWRSFFRGIRIDIALIHGQGWQEDEKTEMPSIFA
jgi:hypothetical protein